MATGHTFYHDVLKRTYFLFVYVLLIRSIEICLTARKGTIDGGWDGKTHAGYTLQRGDFHGLSNAFNVAALPPN